MVDWYVTAVTVYCNVVDRYTTLLIYEDGSTKCSIHKKLREVIQCDGPECHRLIDYCNKVFTEDGNR